MLVIIAVAQKAQREHNKLLGEAKKARKSHLETGEKLASEKNSEGLSA